MRYFGITIYILRGALTDEGEGSYRRITLIFAEMPTAIEHLIGFLTLLLMEVALGIDNVIFIGLIAESLPPARRKAVWRFWLIYSPMLRAGLIVGALYLFKASTPLFSIAQHPISLRELLLIGGGLFLLYKAVKELHRRSEGVPERVVPASSVLGQVALVDLVFSADSILTAVGMSRQIGIMLGAMGGALILMVLVGQRIQAFIAKHPTVKMLALAFLLLIGFTLVAEGTGFPIPKGYIYFAMLFSLGVELLNLRAGLRGQKPAAP